jgi:hypothetical protein
MLSNRSIDSFYFFINNFHKKQILGSESSSMVVVFRHSINIPLVLKENKNKLILHILLIL